MRRDASREKANVSRLVYQSKHAGSYIVLQVPEGVQLGTVAKLHTGWWQAVSVDGKANFAFRTRREGGLFLHEQASVGGCPPGCTCAEG